MLSGPAEASHKMWLCVHLALRETFPWPRQGQDMWFTPGHAP